MRWSELESEELSVLQDLIEQGDWFDVLDSSETDDLTRVHQGWGLPSARQAYERAANSLVVDEEVLAGDSGPGPRQARRPARDAVTGRLGLASTFFGHRPDPLPFGSQAERRELARHRSPSPS